LEKVERRRTLVWTIEELKSFLALKTDYPWHPNLCVIALTGLCRGEALRLTWATSTCRARGSACEKRRPTRASAWLRPST
jgi:integrase